MKLIRFDVSSEVVEEHIRIDRWRDFVFKDVFRTTINRSNELSREDVPPSCVDRSFIRALTVTSSGLRRVIAKWYKALTSSFTTSSSKRATIIWMRLCFTLSKSELVTIQSESEIVVRNRRVNTHRQISVHRAWREYMNCPSNKKRKWQLCSWTTARNSSGSYGIVSLTIFHWTVQCRGILVVGLRWRWFGECWIILAQQ